MKNKISQLNRVEKRIKQNGEITRNQCLSTFPAITRLSSIILKLKQQGYEFETFSRNGDYVYKVVISPKDKFDLEVAELKEQQLKLKYV